MVNVCGLTGGLTFCGVLNDISLVFVVGGVSAA